MKKIPCRSCGAEIGFIRLTSGKYMPVDPTPVRFGDCTKRENLVTPAGVVRSINPAALMLAMPDFADGFGYRSHYFTCPQAAAHRRSKQA